jgi:poly(3-hydroxybutyrate) depolymerase
MLHGYTGTPASIETTSGWTNFVNTADAVIAYPQGRPVSGNTGYAWNTKTARFSNPGGDDVTTVLATADLLISEYCVDPASVVLAGESNGGAMVVLTACDPRSQGRFRLVVPAIAAIDRNTTAACSEGSPVPLLAISSKQDRTVTYDGRYPTGTTPLDGQEVWFQRVAEDLNRCSHAAPTRTTVTDGEMIEPIGCTANTLMVAVADGTHTWPGGPKGTGGLDPGAFDASAYVWSVAFG